MTTKTDAGWGRRFRVEHREGKGRPWAAIVDAGTREAAEFLMSRICKPGDLRVVEMNTLAVKAAGKVRR